MAVYEALIAAREKKGGAFLLLLDPDRSHTGHMLRLAEAAAESEVDAILVGSSFMLRTDFNRIAREIKEHATVPIIIFPGAHSQISPYADAVLFTSLISGRNPHFLIEEQVRGAPLIKEFGLEPIPTGYMLIDSGTYTSVQYISNTMPIPSDKTDIACAHALAAQYMGMKMIFMEAGSGAGNSVPESMIKAIAGYTELPLIVGGGIEKPDMIESKIAAGASFVVVGSRLENDENLDLLKEFASAAHPLEHVSL